MKSCPVENPRAYLRTCISPSFERIFMQILDVDFPPAGCDGSTCGFQSSRNFIHTFSALSVQEENHMILFNTLFCFIMMFILLPCLQCWSTPRCKVLRHVFKPSALLSWWGGREILALNVCTNMTSRETNPIKIVKSRNRDWPFIV